MVLFRLITAALLPVVVAVMFYLIEKKSKFSKFPYFLRQAIIGLSFGFIACLATSFGVEAFGAVINVRNAAPLTGGLIFGGPAGIISGLIGAIHRFLYTELECLQTGFSGTGEYTQIACTISTALSGIIGVLCRRFIFDNKKAGWFYGLAIGMFSEIFHMLLVFITNSNDIHTAFEVVSAASTPMIAANSLSVMCTCFVISVIGKEEKAFSIKNHGNKPLTQSFQTGLIICVLISFLSATQFTVNLQNKIADADIDDLLTLNTQAVPESIEASTETSLSQYVAVMARGYFNSRTKDAQKDKVLFETLQKQFGFHEMHAIENDGTISQSTIHSLVGENIFGYKEFDSIEDTAVNKAFVQRFGPSAFDNTQMRKYVGFKVKDGMMLVGYLEDFLASQLKANVEIASENRYVGQTGFVIITDENNLIVSSHQDEIGKHADSIGIKLGNSDENAVFSANINGEECFCKHIVYESIAGDYNIIAVYPKEEAMFSKNISTQINTFMQILVFIVLFGSIYVMIKRLVVDKIHSINTSLAKITGGDLDEKVDVRDHQEFASLSDDINSTVDTLKHYIDEAAARIDKELEYAKNIQRSALPSVFPPFPNRTDFDIYATMEPAKEVGGDFYDFYLLDNDKLGVLIADVSGKGIPAAMFMMRAKTTLKGLVESGIEVDEVLSRANKSLCEGNDAGVFVTVWLGIVDLRTGILNFGNAGHNPPFIRHKNGEFEMLKSRPNFVLGGMEGVKYTKNEVQLLPGDEIFMYTDGVTEATNLENELFTEERLIQVLNKNPNEGVENRLVTVKEYIDSFVGSAEQFDDITMVSFGLNYFRNFDSITVNPQLNPPELVIEFIRKKISKFDIDPKVAMKVFVTVDEIYSNILHYSKATKAQVFCDVVEKEITLVFKDNGIAYDPINDSNEPDITLSAQEREIGGLGIFMVKKMASSLEYEYNDSCNILTVKFQHKNKNKEK
ncbi:MAG: SpoIIE family protein phosphatase [Eubacteriales bacterium]|nr:SpoIIE family protein phosphatase [Eubacteriales bacterium]